MVTPRCAGLAVLALPLCAAGCPEDRPSADVTLTIDGAVTRLLYGQAYPSNDGLALRLSARPRTCETPATHDAGTTLYVDLPPGPGGRFYAGQTVGLAARVSAALGDVLWARSDQSAVRLEAFTAAPGSRVRGKLRLDATTRPRDRARAFSASGSFEVTVCGGGKPGLRVTPQPAEAPAGSVKGTFAGRPFAFQSALLESVTDPRSHARRADRLVLFPTPGARCSALWKDEGDPDVLELRDLGQPLDLAAVAGGSPESGDDRAPAEDAGPRGPGPAVGSPQPAEAFFASGKTRGGPLGGRVHSAWVRFDALRLERGGTATGALVADSDPSAEPEATGSVGGHFTARVCERSSLPAAASAVTLRANDGKAELTFGHAWAFGDGLQVAVATKPFDCGVGPTPAPGMSWVELTLPPGPGGTFFAGHPAGLAMRVKDAAAHFEHELPPSAVTVEIAPFKAEEGAAIRASLSGSYRFATGAGTDAVTLSGELAVALCEDPGDLLPGLSGLASEAPAGEVEGTYGGVPFKARSAVAVVQHDADNDLDVVRELRFFPAPGGTCTTVGDRFELRSPGGAGSNAPLLGSAQPAEAALRRAGGFVGTFHHARAGAWVRFESLQLAPGGKVRGSLLAESPPDVDASDRGRIGGHFEATVCRP